MTDTWVPGTVPAAASAIVQHVEGFRARPYDDNGPAPGGRWTIGYGCTRDFQGAPVTLATKPITEAQACSLLARDMTDAALTVARGVTVPLLVNQAAAMISWTYNLGAGNLGRSGLLARINAHLTSVVPAIMRQYINAAGQPMLGLLRRRWAEAALFTGLDVETAIARAWGEIVTLKDWPAFS